MLLSPRDGFRAALANAERRQRVGLRPAEGAAPLVLAAIGGVATALLWLKVGALIGAREVCNPQYLTGYIVATGLLGAILGLAGQSVWGRIAPRLLGSLHGERPDPHELRLVWGAAAFPQVFALFLLLPLDLLIVGQDTFTTTELVDPVSTAWAAFSIALGVSALVWSVFLLVRGVESSSGLTGIRAVAGAGTVLLSLALVVGVPAAATLLRGGAGCPT
ncbi:MAG: hypothetical protein M3N53_04720 [Actinomycetota bacterium]|nr:hypothetical protein [Actinomycetota bacterium]